MAPAPQGATEEMEAGALSAGPVATGKGLGPVGLKRVRSVDFSRGAGWTQHSQRTKSYRRAGELGVGSGGGDYEALVWPEQAVWEVRQQNLTLGRQKQEPLPDGDGDGDSLGSRRG